MMEMTGERWLRNQSPPERVINQGARVDSVLRLQRTIFKGVKNQPVSETSCETAGQK